MFQLTKIWIDPRPDFENVEIRYKWLPLAEGVTFNGDEDSEVMAVVPNTNPRVREAIIEIPRYVKNQDNYSFHYQFLPGGTQGQGPLSPVFTEEIVAREVEYIDHDGWVTEVRVVWGVGGWTAPNLSRMDLDGLVLNIAPDAPGHDREGEGIADEAIYELISTVPLPRRWVGKVWGPKANTIEYAFQLLRNNTPTVGDDGERWDNNNGQNYQLSL
jgi:hypothetical protein